MSTAAPQQLSMLYEQDETAWFQMMSELAAQGQVEELDLPHLSEYLQDMAKRDYREVYSRLVVLWTNLLKWEHQPAKRTGSWHGTIMEQQRELRLLLQSRTLRNHAKSILQDTHSEARRQAVAETGLALETFPEEDRRGIDGLLTELD